MPGGSLADLVQRFGQLDEAVIRKYTREVLEGLAYLHALVKNIHTYKYVRIRGLLEALAYLHALVHNIHTYIHAYKYVRI